MTATTEYHEHIEAVLSPFPNNSAGAIQADRTNPAIRIYGRRFYKDQTPVEYLAEFLLVFVSSKTESGEGAYQFKVLPDTSGEFGYWPEDRVALKLFAFFPSSKLETRHPVHRKAYLDAVNDVQSLIKGSPEQKEETIRLIQSLLSGFVGVAKDRTWATYSFLPASTKLLGRELDWLHSTAIKDDTLEDWQGAKQYFATDRHNFMARGGELLFLQLANLFDAASEPELAILVEKDEYQHLGIFSVKQLEHRLEQGLRAIIETAIRPLNGLVALIEERLSDYRIAESAKVARLGWVPKVSLTEALLFAAEIENICSLSLSSLEKLDLLQTLCCMHVLRSLCFQAVRVDAQVPKTLGFAGNYAWVACDADIPSGAIGRQLSQNSISRIDAVLYRVLRNKQLPSAGQGGSMSEADSHGYKIFRKIGKELGLIIPRRGAGERFCLHPKLIRFLVAALVRPGEYIRLNRFYDRVFAHYGIAVGGEPLATALSWLEGGSGDKSYGVDLSTGWVEEALQQGGFLIELSDAVSIVHNPGGGEVRV